MYRFAKKLLHLIGLSTDSLNLNKHIRSGTVTGKSIEKDGADVMREAWATREDSMVAVPRVAIESSEQLMELYISQNKPIVITNFQDKWADRLSFGKNSLKQDFGDSIVRISVSESGRFDGPENGTLWGLGKDVDVLVRCVAGC